MKIGIGAARAALSHYNTTPVVVVSLVGPAVCVFHAHLARSVLGGVLVQIERVRERISANVYTRACPSAAPACRYVCQAERNVDRQEEVNCTRRSKGGARSLLLLPVSSHATRYKNPLITTVRKTNCKSAMHAERSRMNRVINSWTEIRARRSVCDGKERSIKRRRERLAYFRKNARDYTGIQQRVLARIIINIRNVKYIVSNLRRCARRENNTRCRLRRIPIVFPTRAAIAKSRDARTAAPTRNIASYGR